ncbi:MAG: hypothetical protein IPM37_23320 [Hahellaceae bacterium]|nr:hypothetical protein [Hahellaceae bacterium]
MVREAKITDFAKENFIKHVNKYGCRARCFDLNGYGPFRSQRGYLFDHGLLFLAYILGLRGLGFELGLKILLELQLSQGHIRISYQQISLVSKAQLYQKTKITGVMMTQGFLWSLGYIPQPMRIKSFSI